LKRGIGCAVGTWGGGGNDQCKVEVLVSRDGSVVVKVGTQDLGTGTRTFTRAIVAEELGLQVKDVAEQIGNSSLGRANDSGGSTTAASLAPSVKDAAYKARIAVAERIAPLLGNAKPENLSFANGTVVAGDKSITWKQACAALPAAGIAAHGEWRADLQARGVHGVCFAEVEIDVETGKVRPIKMVQVQDCGLPLNRLTMESQINGGMIQSLGMAFWEGRVIDKDPAPERCRRMNVHGEQIRDAILEEIGHPLPAAFPQPMRDPVKTECRHSRIEDYVPPRARGRIAGFNGVEIGDEPGLQAS